MRELHRPAAAPSSAPAAPPLHGIVDKSGVLEKIAQMSVVELELGCGAVKRHPAAIGVDMLDYPCVDIVGDALVVLRSVPDASVDAIRSWHFLEHVPDVPALFAEMERVLKAGGTLDITVPHFSNPFFYSDHTHRTFFGLYTFCYLAVNRCLTRAVPTYGRELRMALEDVTLHFGSFAPHHARHLLKKTLGRVFNSTTYLKEFYEENLCYLFPCYELEYRLRKL